MRLLFISGTYHPARAGAEVSAQTALRLLQKVGVECFVATRKNYRLPVNCPTYIDGVRIYWLQHEDRERGISDLIDILKPDVILTQLLWSEVALKIAKSKNVPSVLRVCSIPHVFDISRDAVNSPKRVFTISRAAAEDLKMRWGRSCWVIPPAIDLKRVVAESIPSSHKGYVTMFNPVVSKGGYIFWQIAKSMPECNFAVVPGWGCLRDEMGNFDERLIRDLYISLGLPKDTELPIEIDFSDLPNVTQLSLRDNVSEIYSCTSILCVPSQVAEGYGRVAMEAFLNGIPVLASDVGGLRELVSHAGILVQNYSNASSWVRHLNRLKSPSIYEEYSRRALAYSARYDVDKIIVALRTLLEDAVHEGG